MADDKDLDDIIDGKEFGDLEDKELDDFYGSEENPRNIDVAQEPTSMVPANSAINEPELKNPDDDQSEPEKETDSSYESRIHPFLVLFDLEVTKMLNCEICSDFGQELLPLVSSETQNVAQEPFLGVVSPITHVEVQSQTEHTPVTQPTYRVRLASESNLVLGNSEAMHVSLFQDLERQQKEMGKRKASGEDEYDKSRSKKQNTTMLVEDSSKLPDSPVTQGFEAGPSIGRGEGSGGGGSSGNVQPILAHIHQSQLRHIERRTARINQDPIDATEVPRDGPPRSTLGQSCVNQEQYFGLSNEPPYSDYRMQQHQQNTAMFVGGSSNLPNSAGGDQDSGGGGSSGNVQPLRANIHQAQLRFIERRTARINQNPVHGPDVPQPFDQGGAKQAQGGRGQGVLNMQGQFQQQGRGRGDQNLQGQFQQRGRGRGDQNLQGQFQLRGRGRGNQNRGRGRGNQNRGRGRDY